MLKVGAGVHETDVEWEKWGASDPYFGVLTHDRFRTSAMTSADYAEFFDSGRAHVEAVLASCRRHFGDAFRPSRVLDFGCGVGRLVVPFAETCDAVVGVDVSDSMLAEARRNCARFGVTNATLVRGDDTLGAVEGRFDLVHSTIVFQHIESERGLDILARLVGLVAPEGVAAIHVTYGRSYGRCRYGRPLPDLPPPPPPPTLRRRLRAMVRQLLGPGHRADPAPAQPREADADPVMMMYHYDLSRIAYMFQAAGAAGFHAEFTDHGGELGATLYARLPAADADPCAPARDATASAA